MQLVPLRSRSRVSGYSCQKCDTQLKNSLIIHEENTKEITTMAVSLYVIKAHVSLYKTFALIFLNLDNICFEYKLIRRI